VTMFGTVRQDGAVSHGNGDICPISKAGTRHHARKTIAEWMAGSSIGLGRMLIMSPPLKKALAKGWRVEVAFISGGISTALHPVVHEFRAVTPSSIEYDP
jgi:hypothetical protein